MKKTLIALGVFALSMSSISFGATIGDISLRFCNGTGEVQKALSLNFQDTRPQDICMQLSNSSSEDTYVTLGFVDGAVTNDADQKKACKNEGDNTNFGKYVNRDNKPVLVPAGQTITTNTTIQFPEEVAGEVHGCVTYFIANKTNDGQMFTVMVRRANFIDALVKGVVSVGLGFTNIDAPENNLSNNKKIVSYYNADEKKLYIQAALQNKGTAEQKTTIKGTISNRFGYSKTFIEEERKLPAKQSSNLNAVVDNLPFYMGPFTIKYTVTHEAILQQGLEAKDGDANGTLTEKAGITIITSSTYIMLGGLLIFLLLIGTIIFLLKKQGKQTQKAEPKHHTAHHSKK